MKAYKFKSALQVEHVLDILINQRLFCADWQKLNDPLEGRFSYFTDSKGIDERKKRVSEIISSKKQIKVCSLSKVFDSHLLWAHYANGYNGVAIEVDLPEKDNCIMEVKYERSFKTIDDAAVDSPGNLAQKILCTKYQEWKYEREIRILNPGAYYTLERPASRLIVGQRVNPLLRDTLKMVCSENDVSFAKIEFQYNGQIAAIPYPIKNGADLVRDLASRHIDNIDFKHCL